MVPRRRTRLPRWLALPALALLLPLVGELWARYRIGYGNPRRIVGSEAIGYRLEPGQTIEGTRGCVERVNDRGYRDRAWPATPPAGVRIVVLGDTAAYAPGVAVEASWPRLLEEELRALGRQATVFRLAVPGYTVAQMVGAWEADGRALAPQLVVVELSATSVRPMRVLHEPEHYPLEGLLRSSSLWDWIRRAWLVRPAGEGWPAERRVLADPYDPANDRLWAEARAQLGRLHAELEARGARLMLLAAPSLAAVLDPDGEDTRWPAWAAQHELAFVSPSGALRAQMAPLLEEIAARGLDPAQVWNRDSDVEHLRPERLAVACFLPEDPVHVDERGHRAVLQALLPVVEGLLSAPGEER
jgi:hypothetical protein